MKESTECTTLLHLKHKLRVEMWAQLAPGALSYHLVLHSLLNTTIVHKLLSGLCIQSSVAL